MNKIALIIGREYSSRVKKKSFLLMTFLVPLLFLVMWGGIIFLGMKDSDTVNQVFVWDQSGIFAPELTDSKSLTFHVEQVPQDVTNPNLENIDEESFLLVIPSDVNSNPRVEFYSKSGANLFLQDQVLDQLNEILSTYKLKEAGIDPSLLQETESRIRMTSKEVTKEGTKDSSAGAAMVISMVCSILIYVTLFIYGAQVMRGVIEEKNNRIIEIIISSVKPFELMIGKIIGIGLVGLTQFILWIVLSTGLFVLGGSFLETGTLSGEASQIAEGSSQAALLGEVHQALGSINFTYIISIFLVYFIGGYLLYSALFAAVGSAVDNETETQQFMLPITMPLLFTYMMSFSVLLKDPDGALAFWLSMIPFTSPIAMLVRLPSGVPSWELVLSIALLIAGFLFTTWIASRIYRVGILMYGKKASYKELFKWFTYKG